MVTTEEALKAVEERNMQQSILDAARDAGWKGYRTHDSQRSEPGFPDLVLVKAPRVLFVECKTMTGELQKGKWNKQKKRRWLPGQDEWKAEFEACPGVEYRLVRPGNLQEMYETLLCR